MVSSSAFGSWFQLMPSNFDLSLDLSNFLNKRVHFSWEGYSLRYVTPLIPLVVCPKAILATWNSRDHDRWTVPFALPSPAQHATQSLENKSVRGRILILLNPDSILPFPLYSKEHDCCPLKLKRVQIIEPPTVQVTALNVKLLQGVRAK